MGALETSEGGGGALAGHQIDQGDPPTPAFDLGSAHDTIDGVVAPLDQGVGLEFIDEVEGGVFGEEHDGVDGLEGAEDAGAFVLGVDGAGGAFEAFDGGVVVEADDEEVAHGGGLFEEGDVPAVEDVEAAVGEDNFFALLAEGGEFELGLVEGTELSDGGCGEEEEAVVDLFEGDGLNAEDFDFEAGGGVGEADAVGPGAAVGTGGGEGGEEHVARAGDVVDLSGDGGEGGGLAVAGDEECAVPVEGENAGVEVEALAEGGGEGDVSAAGAGFVGALAEGVFGFGAVWGDGGGAAVFGVVNASGGVDEDGLAGAAGGGDDALAEFWGADAFVVVFDADGVDGIEVAV